MTLQEAMRARHMVRKYTDKPLPQDVVEQLQQRINENNEKLHLDIRLMINDTNAYQVRMLATAILGRLAADNDEALCFLKEQVSTDSNWRVQEMLAKAFDEVCGNRGYENSLPLIEEWMNADVPNVIRAVTEGLRIWASRPFFREHPSLAIALLSKHKSHESEYLRKSVGNALKDISKKHRAMVWEELETWDLSNPKIRFTYNLAMKNMK